MKKRWFQSLLLSIGSFGLMFAFVTLGEAQQNSTLANGSEEPGVPATAATPKYSSVGKLQNVSAPMGVERPIRLNVPLVLVNVSARS